MGIRVQQVGALLLLALFMSPTGCGRTTQTRFYTLSNPMPDGTEDAPMGNDAVEIMPVALPELLDRPQVVLYAEADRVRILEEDRWAASLQSEIRQSIGEKVRGRLGMIDLYYASPHHGESAKGKTYRIVVSIELLKIVPGHAAALQAAWVVRAIGEDQSVLCRTGYREALHDGSIDGAILAYRKAIDALGTRVAASLQDGARETRKSGSEQGECMAW